MMITVSFMARYSLGSLVCRYSATSS